MDPTRTTGKLGIVTGAESGIGRATALRLAVELVTADVTTQKVGLHHKTTGQAGSSTRPAASAEMCPWAGVPSPCHSAEPPPSLSPQVLVASRRGARV